MIEQQLPLLNHRVDSLEKVVSRIDASLEKLVRLEERHIETREDLNRIYAKVEAYDSRIRALENEGQANRVMRTAFWWLGSLALVALLQYVSRGIISLWPSGGLP